VLPGAAHVPEPIQQQRNPVSADNVASADAVAPEMLVRALQRLFESARGSADEELLAQLGVPVPELAAS